MAPENLTGRDKIDQKIIDILNENARASSKDIANELGKMGQDVSDRTIRKRIERLENTGIIKGYKAILNDSSDAVEFEALFLKLKISGSTNLVKTSMSSFVKKSPGFLFIALLDGDWNLMIVMRKENSGVTSVNKVLEKFSENILDYKISKFEINDVSLENMSLLII